MSRGPFPVMQVPTTSSSSIVLEPTAKAPIVIVGPNGSGKSALGAYLQTQLGPMVNRIFAHRRVWLSSSAPELSPAQLQQYASSFITWNNSPESRWRDHADSARVSLIIQEVLDRQNAVNAAIADRVRRGLDVGSIRVDGPLQLLNGILAEAALNIAIQIGPGGELLTVNSNGSSYPVAEMSDGEKAAMLLIADVLVADEHCIHLIDEPERHLHRSISASLINSLITLRDLDSFVVLTHDLELAIALGRPGRTFVCSGCNWSGKSPIAWSMDEVTQGEHLPEDLKRAILGGRSDIVFHEGVTGGLDQQLYEALLQGWTIVAAGSCTAVLRSVSGLRTQTSLHWLNPKGVVDKDFRRGDAPQGIVHLALHEIENVFYHSKVLGHMAKLQANHLGMISAQLLETAYQGMRAELGVQGVRANIVGQRCIQALRDSLTEKVANIKALPQNGSLTLSEKVSLETTGAEYDKAISDPSANLDAFLQKFPVRESGLRVRTAKALLYPSKELYEQAVIQQAKQDAGLRTDILKITGLARLPTA